MSGRWAYDADLDLFANERLHSRLDEIKSALIENNGHAEARAEFMQAIFDQKITKARPLIARMEAKFPYLLGPVMDDGPIIDVDVAAMLAGLVESPEQKRDREHAEQLHREGTEKLMRLRATGHISVEEMNEGRAELDLMLSRSQNAI